MHAHVFNFLMSMSVAKRLRQLFSMCVALALPCAGVLIAPDAAAQGLVSYDAFSTPNINPAKWYGDDGRTYGGIRTEVRRATVSSQGHIELRTWGDIVNNTGSSSSRNSLIAVNSSTITAMRATVTMRSTITNACPGNPSQPALARARLFGFFFNPGDAIPGSNMNDVFAGIQLYRASNSVDPSTTYRVSAFIGICGDDSCISSTSLGSQDMGTVDVNVAVALQMTWDPSANRFTFQRGSQTPINLPYVLADTKLASYPVKRLEISNIVPRCTGTPRPNVFASADFDDVLVNPSALTLANREDLLLPQAEEKVVDFDPLVGPLN